MFIGRVNLQVKVLAGCYVHNRRIFKHASQIREFDNKNTRVYVGWVER